jgi:hypothetical protein
LATQSESFIRCEEIILSDMVETSPTPLARGPVWKRIRLEVLILSASLAGAGAILMLIPWPENYSQLLDALGIALILAGLIVAATRPWNFMKRMEMQLLIHQERLQGQMSEIRRQEERMLADKRRQERQ